MFSDTVLHDRHGLHVVVISGDRANSLDGWGDEVEVNDVVGILTDAGVPASAVRVSSPDEIAALAAPGVLAFPNARVFCDRWGNRHSIPGLLEQHAVRVIGSGSVGHGTSKSHMKKVLAKNGLPTPRWLTLAFDELGDLDDLRFPLVVKPDCGSESMGVVRVEQRSDLIAAMRGLEAGSPGPVVVEEWKRDREFTVAVIGNGGDRLGLPLEVVVPQGHEFLSAEVKLHLSAGTAAPVSEGAMSERLGDLAIAACRTLQIDDWARVDILEDDNGELHIIDVNTLPGMRRRSDKVSYFPVCLSYRGLDYPECILALVGVSLRRHGFNVPAPSMAAYQKLFRFSTGDIPPV